MASGQSDHLGELERQLYGRQAKLSPLRRSRLASVSSPAQSDWSRSKAMASERRRFKISLLTKIALATFLFFAAMAGITFFIFYRGANLISSGNIELKAFGPLTIRAGEPLQLQVTVTNQNQAPLEFVDLIIEYPPGSRSLNALSEPLERERLPLGHLEPGRAVNRTVEAVFFGEQDEKLEIKLATEYRLANSNAIFDKQIVYPVTISSAPVTVAVTLPEEVNSNQELTLNLEITANAPVAETAPLVIVSYPAGFSFKKAAPPPSAGENIWTLAQLASGEKLRLRIDGVMEGQDDELKVFRVTVGLPKPEAPEELGVVFASALGELVIRRPFVGLTASLNGDTGSEYIAASRQPLRLDIDWINNLPAAVTDGELVLAFSGSVLDQPSVSPVRGFYQSAQNTVLWNKASDPSLARIDSGQGSRASVTFSTVSLVVDPEAIFKNPVLDLVVRFRGRREVRGQAGEPVESVVEKKIKLNTVAQLAAKALYFSGPFTNAGPLPPKVGEETTYTIVWSVINSSNDLDDAAVTAVLPPYVKWLEQKTPATEDLLFTARSGGGGEIVWPLGRVRAGTGLATAAREVSFPISFTPSVSQSGEVPALLSAPVLTGVDTFTGATINYPLRRELDTNLIADPQFRFGQERVAP